MNYVRLAVGFLLVGVSIFVFYFFVYLPFVPVDPENPGYRLDDFIKNWYGEEKVVVHSNEEESTQTPVIKKTYKPIFKLKIPSLNRSFNVYDGADRNTLMRGPAHIKGTAYPGDSSGNVCISGHRVTYGGPFRHVDRLKAGDRLIIEAGSRVYEYQVVWIKRVKPAENWVLAPTVMPSLTLTTCDPPFSARYRLVVRAVMVNSGQ